jgi:quinol monooxygenase YgiN
MVKMYVRHTVADFARWKVVYDEHDAMRKKFGCKKSEVFTNAHNPNDVLSVHQWDDKEQASKFMQSPDLKEAMVNAGVTSMPQFDFV